MATENKSRPHKSGQPAEEPKLKVLAKIEPQPIVAEMKESYLDYAMSVIVARALPDVRDGLKPVQRRILVTLNDLGLRPHGRFRKSAKIAGDVSGNYHPHGEAIVYPSMVHLAQGFKLRYPLVSGQGNFGSIDGDPPAAMRYTEARMSSAAAELLADLYKETVDWVDNYDGTRKEPRVLPAKFPNLLINGTLGIAVGMASSIPPHNLTEVCNAGIYLLDHPEATVDDLIEIIPGPDFPTGGIIYNTKDIEAAYATGRGAVVARGVAEIQENKSGLFQIFITELPFQVNKAEMITHVAELVQAKRIEGIRDIRDESGKEGIRIVIDLKKEAFPKKVLNQLYRYTQLQEAFHFNLVALVDGLQPRLLTLKSLLEYFLLHRQEVIRRRTQFELNEAKDRAHILEGLKIALDKIDAVIKVIKASKDKETAKINLMKKFRLSERQSLAILEMKLASLANLERLKIEGELKEKRALIKELTSILASKARIKKIVKDELTGLRDKYGDERRTKVVKSAVGEMTAEDLIPKEPCAVMVTLDGYIKRLPPDTFKSQKRGGKGVIGLTTKEEDSVKHFFVTNTHSDLYFFTNSGKVFQLKAYEVPAATRTAKGQALANFLQLGQSEEVTVVHSVEDLEACKFLVMVTKNGVIKKVGIESFTKVRRSGLLAVRLKPGDQLQWVKPSTGHDTIMLMTARGQAIRFKETKIRNMGRSAAGVRGIKLKSGDQIIAMTTIDGRLKDGQCHVLIVTENGFGKRTGLGSYKIQNRGGTGIKTAKVTPKTGQIVSAMVVNKEVQEEDLIIVSSRGQVIRLPLKAVPIHGRATQGVRLQRFKEPTDKVAQVTQI